MNKVGREETNLRGREESAYTQWCKELGFYYNWNQSYRNILSRRVTWCWKNSISRKWLVNCLLDATESSKMRTGRWSLYLAKWRLLVTLSLVWFGLVFNSGKEGWINHTWFVARDHHWWPFSSSLSPAPLWNFILLSFLISNDRNCKVLLFVSMWLCKYVVLYTYILIVNLLLYISLCFFFTQHCVFKIHPC